VEMLDAPAGSLGFEKMGAATKKWGVVMDHGWNHIGNTKTVAREVGSNARHGSRLSLCIHGKSGSSSGDSRIYRYT